MQLGSGGAVITPPPPPTVGLGQSHAEEPGKFDFYYSKSHSLACYLLIFYINLSVVRGIFVSIQAREIIMNCYF